MRTDKRYLVAIAASYVVAGAALPWSHDDAKGLGPISLIHMSVLSFLFFGWCTAHSRAIGVTPPYGARFLMGAAPPVGLPYYSIRTLGLAKGAWLSVKGLALLLASAILSGIGMLASEMVRA